ncbi:MAG TPA: pyridoxal 5'-phosphate synthase glutaminase subunit PdxT [Acidimicrobiia bacterium]|nr:pyridoxal 5'-phosphate synthase glutaminase subunit PdxT [Acidimicrobiia bacterium]
MKLAVLALQGAFREHREVLDALGADVVEVRQPHQLSGVDALLLPGGESTTMAKLLDSSGLFEPVRGLVRDGVPTFGTCAGMILLAREVVDGRADQHGFDVLDLRVRRNGYGRQVASFEADLDVDGLRGGPFRGVFIRAPYVERTGDDVEVLARHDGVPVLVRHGSIWASSFHPELSGDLRLHELFLQEVKT